MSRIATSAALCAMLSLLSPVCGAESYRIGVAPLMSQEETQLRYRLLLQYLKKKTGHQFELVTTNNFMGYWSVMLKPAGLHFALDGAHLAGYRVKRRGHRFIARLDGVVSYSLIVRADDLILEAEELLNRSLAVLPAPNMSAIAASQVFNNPMRQPNQVPVANAETAMEAVRSGTADAAFVPTPFLQRYPEANVVMTTEQMPGMTMTASAEVPELVGSSVQKALLGAADEPEGKKALDELRFVRFIRVSEAEYEGLENLLKEMWGY